MKHKNVLYSLGVATCVAVAIVVGTTISNRSVAPATDQGETAAVTSAATTQADANAAGRQADGGFVPFWRIDRDDPEQWKGELDNLRIFAPGKYEFKPNKDKYKLDYSQNPDETGLDTLACSASAQFSIPQLATLKETLEPLAAGKQITIFDLRQESHGFLDERGFSWYGENNWANKGMNREQVRADEDERLGSLVGTEVRAHARDDDELTDELVFTPKTYVSEEQAVTDAGLAYVRLPCTDHSWPAAELIDEFFDYVQGVGIDNIWPHFHCHAGKGRTGIFMIIFDKMKNPDVDEDQIVLRQTMTGSNYPFYTDEDGYKKPLYEEIAAKMPLMFRYIDENRADGYKTPWSAWLAAHENDAVEQKAAA